MHNAPNLYPFCKNVSISILFKYIRVITIQINNVLWKTKEKQFICVSLT